MANYTDFYTAGTKQFGAIPPIWVGYQTKESALSNITYFDNNSLAPITAVATGTFSVITTNKLKAADLFNTVYNPEDGNTDVPLVTQSRNYVRITSAAANDGAKITLATPWDISNDNWITVVLSSPGTSIAGKLKVRTSTGNEFVYAFTTSATANTRTAYKFQPITGFTGVTITGTPVRTNITELEITLDAITTSVDVFVAYSCNDLLQTIGEKISIAMDCLTDFGMEENLETADRICNQLVEAKVATGRSITGTFKTQKKNLLQYALANGGLPQNSLVRVSAVANSETIGKRAISAGAVTLGTGLKILRIIMPDGTVLNEYGLTTDLDTTMYNYNSSTGVLTVNTAYNGRIPTVYVANSIALNNFSTTGLELGYVGYMTLARRTESGTFEYKTASKAQLVSIKEAKQDSGDEMEITVAFLPDRNGKFLTTATSF